MNDRLDSGLLLVSDKREEEPVHAALCFLMIAEIEVIKELLDLQSSICPQLRARLFAGRPASSRSRVSRVSWPSWHITMRRRRIITRQHLEVFLTRQAS